MNIDNDFDDEYNEDFDHEGSNFDASETRDIPGEGNSKGDFDPFDITDPRSAYFFLSDDVQDELSGTDKRKMKCNSCGHKFIGEIYDGCPECYSANTEELITGIDDEIETHEKPNMKCLSCGHKFVGEIYDDCPECFSADTEEVIAGIGDEEDKIF